MDRSPPPPLLPILRSQQQGELLALLLGDTDLELSVSKLAERAGVPYASVHREVERAERAGLLVSRRVGKTRLVRADTASPHFAGLADVLTKAFGVLPLLAGALGSVDGIEEAYVYGSWAARYRGVDGQRAVGDIDLLVLGDPDRDRLYRAVGEVEPRVGRPIQVTIREAGWLEDGTGSFHDTVAERPLVRVPLPSGES